MNQVHLIRTGCAVAICAVAVACRPPAIPPPIVASYSLGQGCADVRGHATDTWGLTPELVDGSFRDMFVGHERVGCRLFASVPAGEVEARFTALKRAMLNDQWSDDEYAASDTTAGMTRGAVVCYSRYQLDQPSVEIQCFQRPNGGWPPP
jgi:hypothetical protein